MASAIIDRIVHYPKIIKIQGESYRMNELVSSLVGEGPSQTKGLQPTCELIFYI